MSDTIVLTFDDTWFDDAQLGTHAMCVAVSKCVLPYEGRKAG